MSKLVDDANIVHDQSNTNHANDNDVVRRHYRKLSPDEQRALERIKDLGDLFINEVSLSVTDTRCANAAKAKVEEAVMWSVKGITA